MTSKRPFRKRKDDLKYRRLHRDQIREADRAWSAKNRTYRTEYHKKWALANKEKVREIRNRSQNRIYSIKIYGEVKEVSGMYKDRFRHARALGYRSGLEVQVAKELKELGIAVHYEEHKLKYQKPAKTCTYTCDFILPNGIFIETKGYFLTKDRQKHMLIKEQYPDIDLRFVFANSNNKISKGSKTSYADWCNNNGFLYSDRSIPISWINEPNKGRQ